MKLDEVDFGWEARFHTLPLRRCENRKATRE